MKAYLEPEEVKMLEDAAENLRDRLLIRVLFHLGCRISGVLNLEVRHVDFEHSSVIIEHLKSHVRLNCPQCGAKLGRSHSFCPGCGQKVSEAITKEQERRRMRTLPVDPDTLKVLQDYIRRGGPVVRDSKTLTFGVNRHRAWQIVKECAQKAGLPDLANPESGKIHRVSPHRLRDAFAVHAVKLDDSGDGLRLLQEHLGHQSFNTTAKYRKISGEEHRDWYQRLWKENDS